MRTFHAAVGPLQALFRGSCKHHEQACSIRAIGVDECLRVYRIALGFGHLAAVFQHHALRQQLGEGLIVRDQPGIAHQLVEEARVEQVQDRMFDAADVLVYRQPVIGALVHHGGIAVVAGVTGEIPGGLEKGIQRIGLARGFTAAGGAGGFVERRVFLDGGAHAIHHYVFRQYYRQLLGRHGHFAAFGAVDDRDRAAPVALAGYAPVAQAVLGAALAKIFCIERLCNRCGCCIEIHAIEFARIEEGAMLGIGIHQRQADSRISRLDNGLYR